MGERIDQASLGNIMGRSARSACGVFEDEVWDGTMSAEVDDRRSEHRYRFFEFRSGTVGEHSDVVSGAVSRTLEGAPDRLHFLFNVQATGLILLVDSFCSHRFNHFLRLKARPLGIAPSDQDFYSRHWGGSLRSGVHCISRSGSVGARLRR